MEKDAVHADVERLHGHVGADIIHSVPAAPIAREWRIGFRRRARPSVSRAASGLAGRLIDFLHELQKAIPIALDEVLTRWRPMAIETRRPVNDHERGSIGLQGAAQDDGAPFTD